MTPITEDELKHLIKKCQSAGKDTSKFESELAEMINLNKNKLETGKRMKKIKLGKDYTDSITGFSGVATARAEYLYGCISIQLTSRELKDDGSVKERWIDEQRLISGSDALVGGDYDPPPERNMM